VEESEHRPPILDGRNVRCTTLSLLRFLNLHLRRSTTTAIVVVVGASFGTTATHALLAFDACRVSCVACGESRSSSRRGC
jgi:hypothetical protein